MNIITEPTVLVLGRQSLDQANIDKFVKCGWRSDSDVPGQVLMEVAGRTCYQSFKTPRPGGNKAYISHIIETAHGSVCEHAVWTFGVEGVSRSFSHELERHRAGVSPSELSQRYVDCSDIAFVLAPARLKWFRDYCHIEGYCAAGGTDIDELPQFVGWSKHKRWIESRESDIEDYEDDTLSLLAIAPSELSGTDKRKWARQAARDGLPNCTETKLVLTMNARAIRNVCEQRGSRFADAEIRRFANVLYDIMIVEAPHIFSDYTTEVLYDGSRELNTKNRKV